MATCSPPESYTMPSLVGKVFEESCEKMQLVADLLLLKEGTRGYSLSSSSVSSVMAVGHVSYLKSCDSVVASTKDLAISVKDMVQQMKLKNTSKLQKLADSIATQVIVVTEEASHAAHNAALIDIRCKPAKTGIIDLYSFERVRQAIHMSYDKFKLEYFSQLTDELVLIISKTFAESLAVLIHGCTLASEEKKLSSMDQTQFSTCCQCLRGSTVSFLASLKCFASARTDENRKRCLLFGKPLLAAVDAVVDFASAPQFSGTPAVLTREGRASQTEILGGAMAVVSSSIQLLCAARIIVSNDDKTLKPPQLQRFANCMKAVGDASRLLSFIVRCHTPMSSGNPSSHQPAKLLL